MEDWYLFVDESGDFEFSQKGSKYFILTSIFTDDCQLGERLLRLRRQLLLQKIDLPIGFHATSDKQRVRDAVFQMLSSEIFRIDATIFEKAKTHPKLRENELKFYKTVWYYHMKHVAEHVPQSGDRLVVVGASITLNKKKSFAGEAIADVIGTMAGSMPYVTAS